MNKFAKEQIPPKTQAGNIEWLPGEEVDDVMCNFNVEQKQAKYINPNLKKISAMEISENLLDILEKGAPYDKKGTQDDEKYKKIISSSITENLCDKLMAENFIHEFETRALPYPFPEEKAKPLCQVTFNENEVLDAPEYI